MMTLHHYSPVHPLYLFEWAYGRTNLADLEHPRASDVRNGEVSWALLVLCAFLSNVLSDDALSREWFSTWSRSRFSY